MAISPIELIVLVIVGALVVRAIGSGRLASWLGAMAVIVVVVGLGIALTYRVRQMASQPSTYRIDDHTAAWVDEQLARGEPLPTMYGGYGQTGIRETQVRYNGAVLLLLVPLAAFALFRGFRRAGPKGLLAGAAASFLLLIGGFFVLGVRRVEVMRPVEVSGHHMDSHATAEPVDELWDRLTHPRIEMEQKSDDDSMHVELASATAVATNADDENADAHEAVETSAEAHGAEGHADESESVDDPFGDDQVEVVQTESGAHEADNVFAEADVAVDSEPAKEVESRKPPQPRPDWVGSAREYVNKVWRVPVEAGPYLTKTECDRSLWSELHEEVTRRIQELASENMGRSVHVPDLETMALGGTFIANELLADRTYYEEGTASFGPTQTAWALLEFDENDDRRLLEGWQRYARRDGIKITAALSALVLSLLGLVFGLIKVDTWTRGYYTKRLFLGVPAAIIVVIALLGMIAP